MTGDWRLLTLLTAPRNLELGLAHGVSSHEAWLIGYCYNSINIGRNWKTTKLYLTGQRKRSSIWQQDWHIVYLFIGWTSFKYFICITSMTTLKSTVFFSLFSEYNSTRRSLCPRKGVRPAVNWHLISLCGWQHAKIESMKSIYPFLK